MELLIKIWYICLLKLFINAMNYIIKILTFLMLVSYLFVGNVFSHSNAMGRLEQSLQRNTAPQKAPQEGQNLQQQIIVAPMIINMGLPQAPNNIQAPAQNIPQNSKKENKNIGNVIQGAVQSYERINQAWQQYKQSEKIRESPFMPPSKLTPVERGILQKMIETHRDQLKKLETIKEYPASVDKPLPKR